VVSRVPWLVSRPRSGRHLGHPSIGHLCQYHALLGTCRST
jgi:hypothetical protein